MIADSHCHLDYENLYSQLDDVIKRAEINNVTYLLTICTTLDSFEKIKEIVKKYKNIYGTFGIHPHETNKYRQVDKNYILNLKKDFNKIIGIGETGLDFYYNHSDKEIQIRSFEEHIDAACKLNVPVIVHSRNAENETFDILNKAKKKQDLKVLIHCFSGDKNYAKKLLDIGCYISISGIVTFKNTNNISEAVSIIPNENLLVETDSPYLSPTPYRGKSNEPAYIIHTIDKIAEIKKIPKEIVIRNTTNNFKKLFNIT